MVWLTIDVLVVLVLGLLVYASGQDAPPSDRPAEPGERADNEH